MGGAPAIESGVLIGSKRRLIGNDNYQRVLIVSRYTPSRRRPRLQGLLRRRPLPQACMLGSCGVCAALTHRDAGNTPRHNRGVGAAGMRGVAFPGRGSGRPWGASRLLPRPYTPSFIFHLFPSTVTSTIPFVPTVPFHRPSRLHLPPMSVPSTLRPSHTSWLHACIVIYSRQLSPRSPLDPPSSFLIFRRHQFPST
ncbi:hypothetical protein E2C01_048773 [Portunus trituberculatus]|uniref:Uncharacterized protein n=1 Tax=Portunus trituberculatus TaxID=210409 RepID=A0A5B7GE97_PORTR|nr:hypothetical protein [Portunus trituberculatus]